MVGLVLRRDVGAAAEARVRQALDEDKISLGRAAEILRLDLRQMRELVNAWLD